MTMRRILGLLAVFAVVAPTAAFGQTGSADAAVDQPGIGTVVFALDRVGSERNELQAVGRLALANLRVVRVRSVLDAADLPLFEETLAKNRTEVDELRKFLTTTDVAILGADNVAMTFRDYLADNDVAVNDVVTVDVSGGTVTLFVDESNEESAVEETIG